VFTPYREVLSRPGALAFSSAGVIARLPISMVGIGIVLMVSSLYGSYGLAGRVSALYVVTQAVASPQLARLVDRIGQDRVMRPAIAVSSIGLVGLVVSALVHAPSVALYAAAAVTGATIGSFGALVRARWSHLLDDPRQIHTAYSLESALDELVFIVGPVLATYLATGVRPVAGLVVPIVAMIGGGYWFLAQHRTQPPTRALRHGVRHGSVLRSPGMAVVVLVFIGMGSIFGATDVATVAFAQEQGSKSSAGMILAVFALGSMISGLGYGLRHWLSPLWKRFALGVALLAVGVSLFFVVASLPALAAVMFVTGFSIAPTIINGNGLVQQFVGAERLTEGLTWIGTALGLGVSVGSSIAGNLIDERGSHGGFLVVVGSAVFAVLATLVSLRTLRAGTAELLGSAVAAEAAEAAEAADDTMSAGETAPA